MLAWVGLLSCVSSHVDFEISLFKEVHRTEGAIKVGNLVEVSIFRVESEARVTGIRLITALKGTLESFDTNEPFLLRPF